MKTDNDFDSESLYLTLKNRYGFTWHKFISMRKISIYIALFLISLLVLIGLAVLFLSSQKGEEILKNQIVKIINDKVDYTLSIQKLETNLLNNVSFKGIQLSSPDSSKDHFVEIEKLNLNYDLREIFRKKITIDSIDVFKMNMNLKRDSSGTIELPYISGTANNPKKEEEKAFSIELGQINFAQSYINYVDKKMILEGYGTDVSAKIEPLDKDVQVNLLVGSLGIHFQGKETTIESINLDCRLKDEQNLIINDLSMLVVNEDVNANGSIIIDGEKTRISGEVVIEGNASHLANLYPELIPEQYSPVTGTFSIYCTLDGLVTNPDINVTLDFPELKLNNLSLKKGELNAILCNNCFKVNRFNVDAAGGKVNGKGSIYLDKNTYDLELILDELQLESINSELFDQKSLYKGKLAGKLKAAGKLDSIPSTRVDGKISLTETIYKEVEIPDFHVELNSDTRKANFKFTQGQSYINTLVFLDNQRLSGIFSANIPDITQIAGVMNIKDISGEFNADGYFAGTLTSPLIHLDYEGKNLQYRFIPLDEINGTVVYDEGALGFYDTYFTGEIIDISQEFPDFQGGLSYSGFLAGTLDDLHGNLAIDLYNPAYKNYQVKKASLELSLHDNKLDISHLSLLDDEFTINASGYYDISANKGDVKAILGKENDPEKNGGVLQAELEYKDSSEFILEMDGKEVNLSTLGLILKSEEAIDGTINFESVLNGGINNLSAWINLQFKDLTYNTFVLENGNIEVTLNEDELMIDQFEIQQDGNMISGDLGIELNKNELGKLSITPQSKFTGSISSEQFELGAVSRVMKNSLYVTGLLDCDLEFNGSMEDPLLTGDLKVGNGEIDFPGSVPSVENVLIETKFYGRSFRIKEFSGRIQNSPFKLTGQVVKEDNNTLGTSFNLDVIDKKALHGSGTIGKDSLNFELVANNFDLSLLQGVHSSINTLRGRVNTSVMVKGRTRNPDIFGKIEGRNISVQPDFLDAPMTTGTFLINFDKKEAVLDHFSIIYKEGKITSSGYYERKENGYNDLSLKVSGKDLKMKKPKNFILDIKNIDLEYASDKENFNLNGDIVLGESKFLKRLQLQTILTSLRGSERTPKELPSIINNTNLNVRLRDSEKIWIDNNLAKTRLHSEAAITGNLIHPNINGKISIVEGYVVYLDRKFQVEEGIFYFEDPDKFNPTLSLKTISEVRNYRSADVSTYKIYLNLSGTLEHPQVELYSDPILDKPDILSLLTLGVTLDKAPDEQSPGRSDALADALRERLEQVSSDRISGFLSRKTESVLGLNQFSVSGNLMNFNKGSGAQLLAAKRISKNVEVIYKTTIGHMNEQGIGLNYYLTENVSLEGETNQQGVSGIDLKYRVKF